MAKIVAEPITVRAASSSASSFGRPQSHRVSRVRASQPIHDKNNFYKQLGMFSLRKKIEDSVLSAEILAPTALELEEARHIKQEEVVRECNLWDDLAKSNEILVNLAESAKVVDALKDLKYKAEEAKLIMELAEMDAINDGLFKQAYKASIDVNKLLKKYEISKILKELYDKEGASLTIESGCGGVYNEANLAAVDVTPLFLESVPDLSIDDKDLVISFPSCEGEQSRTVNIQHIPTGLTFQSTGERSCFANKMKALNRLKAKLLTILRNQGISRLSGINRSAIVDIWNQEARRYVFYPNKLVQDVKTGVQLPDVSAVLNGNIEPLINAHISMRAAHDTV